MTLEEVNQAVREENVVLWIGAGFSSYAGFPLGRQLTSILNEVLGGQPTSTELNYVAEEFVRIKGREELISTLKPLFLKSPESTHTHDLFRRIGHFKTIITTNYDTLIEDTLGDRCYVVRTSHDIALAPLNKTLVYKVHGDFVNPDQLVITRTDYSKFRRRDFADPFWASIISKLTSKVVIFIGFGNEDEDVWAVFDQIDEYVPAIIQKKRVLIAPNLDQVKIGWNENRNIAYLSMTAAEFMTQLNSELKNHILRDFEDGRVSHETLKTFTESYDLRTSIQNESGQSIISEFSPKSEPFASKITFIVKGKENYDRFQEFQSGIGDELTILQPDIVNLFREAGDFKLDLTDKTSELVLQRVPIEQKASLVFPNHHFELNDVVLKFSRPKKQRYHIDARCNGFRLSMDYDEYRPENIRWNVNFTAPDEMPSTFSCLQVYRAMYYMCSAEPTNVFLERESTPRILPVKHHEQGDKFFEIYKFFNSLYEIEKHFQLRFKCTLNLSDEEIHRIHRVADLIQKGYVKMSHTEGLLFTNHDKTRRKDIDLIREQKAQKMLVYLPKKEIINIMGQQIDLGSQQVLIDNCRMVDGPTKGEFAFISETDDYYHYYMNVKSIKIHSVPISSASDPK